MELSSAEPMPTTKKVADGKSKCQVGLPSKDVIFRGDGVSFGGRMCARMRAGARAHVADFSEFVKSSACLRVS